ncbi:MAG: hypothetical protein GY874_04560 [Desulfobacteraceae bacterium]|nr:hypothetical protein [Desulfobacteraceae bacterium]
MNQKKLEGPVEKKHCGHLSSGCKIWFDDHLASIRQQILQETSQISGNGGSKKVLPKHVSQAALEFAPERRYPSDPTWGQKIIGTVSGITVISAILAVASGMIDYFDKGTQYIDIVKIFAGAIVGSTGASAVTHLRKSK